MFSKQPPDRDALPDEEKREGVAATRVSSALLLGGRRQLVIMHNGREYVLRLTQSGKLILTA